MIKITSGVHGTLEITTRARVPIWSSQSTSRIGSSTCTTSDLIVTRVAIILWINLALMPAALASELGRNGISYSGKELK